MPTKTPQEKLDTAIAGFNAFAKHWPTCQKKPNNRLKCDCGFQKAFDLLQPWRVEYRADYETEGDTHADD